MLGALETIPEVGWAVVVRQPRARAYAGLAAVRRSILLAAAAAALAAAGLSAWLARRMTRPIAQLVGATREVAVRRFAGVPEGALRRGDELGDLARAFDGMARELEGSERRVLEESRRRDALARYLSPEVVELILEQPDRLRLGGERRQVTVLFADVCAFTRIAEKLAPESVVALLNELFTVATEIVHRRRGMIDKFVGDAVMAVWGAPDGGSDDAVRAVAAAEDLRRWVETANRRWQQRYGVEIALAIGIATGLVVAGNLGSEKRLEYTVIGEPVNLAARLETMAQPRQILVAESTRAALGASATLRPLGERALLSNERTTQIYELVE
jgi:class 3 adenylate cyclase